MRRGGLLAIVALALGPAVVAAPAHAAVTKSTFSVPVTQPDATGAPVTLDTDVYLPQGTPPPGGWPFVLFFHGGGSNKDNTFDAGHARNFAEHGYATILYSARGHGNSTGQTSVAGPKEMRDTYDVVAWALGIGGRTDPPHPDFHIDRSLMALSGYSQGGLNTNLAQAWSTDPTLDPYDLRFVADEPGNTPDVTFEALVPNDVVKISFGVGLLETYLVGAAGHVDPIVDKWIGTAGADRPELYGAGDECDFAGHDTPGSTMKQDLAARSVGCLVDRMTVPSYWAQAFDDELFPAQMAIHFWQRASNPENRLYLSTGGHAAPSAPKEVEADKLAVQIAFMDHVIKGTPLDLPKVVYWTRDPAVRVAQNVSAWPLSAWYRQTADRWPPTGVSSVRYRLGADGKAVDSGPAKAGSLRLQPSSADTNDDPIARAVLGSAPIGTSPGEAPPSGTSDAVATFATAPFATDRELSGSVAASLSWTPASSDSQVVLKVFDAAPDGTLTLLVRGVRGLRGATPAETRTAAFETNAMSALIRRGHHVLAVLAAGDASFYKAYPGSAGGALEAGDHSTVTLPLRDPALSGRPGESGGSAGGGACRDRVAPRSSITRARRVRGVLELAGRARDTGCKGARVRRVYVALARTSGRRCRFLGAGGHFTHARSCRRSLYLRVRGTSRWRLRVHGLPAGRYKLWTRAVDRAGNVERKRRRGNFRRVRLP